MKHNNWNGFIEGAWQDTIDVRDFIQQNYKPYAGDDSFLKGATARTSDLMKKITLPVEIDFMKVSSYGEETVTSGRIKIHLDLHRSDISECNVLVVEDIIDSGKTLSYLTEYLLLNGAKSVKTCTLLDKPSRREVNFCPDYVGATIPDEFVIGYGLDYAEKYRALPYVGVLKREVYEK